jgi:plasmid stabilization system protein ParE
VIVGLSWAELQACRHWGSERHRQYLSEHRMRSPKGWHDVAMPAVGWRKLADRLLREAFHPSGRHRKTRNAKDGHAATRQAAQKIERALASIVTHPAMRRQAQAGTSGEVLYVWRTANGPYIPYPARDAVPMFLVPSYSEVAGVGPITTWSPRAELAVDIPELFADPALHEGWD